MKLWFVGVVLGGLLAAGCGDNLKPAGQDAAIHPDAAVPQEDAAAQADAAGGEDGPVTEDGAVGDSGLLPFGSVCTDGAQCESGLCIQFGQDMWCTITCTGDGDCPAGSQGQKCNQQNYCRP